MNTTEVTTGDDIPESEPGEPPQPELIEESSIGQHSECVQLLDRTQRLKPDELELIGNALTQLIETTGCRCARYTVEVVDDARMCLLHQRWKADPSTTDVLTFPMSKQGDPIDGDVAICLDQAERCAAEYGHDRVRELVLYALHGFLHMAGHDDHDEDSYRRMHEEEDRLLESIGFGVVFGTKSMEGGLSGKSEAIE